MCKMNLEERKKRKRERTEARLEAAKKKLELGACSTFQKCHMQEVVIPSLKSRLS
jgi:hypothetical protein